MVSEFNVVDVWVCRFPSEEAVEAYLEEAYDDKDDDAPISKFAADMDELFYDHDFMERGDFYDPPIDDIAETIAFHSFSTSYISQVVQAFYANPLTPFNFSLLVWNREITNPVSVDQSDRVLRYLGRFDCAPDAGPAVNMAAKT